MLTRSDCRLQLVLVGRDEAPRTGLGDARLCSGRNPSHDTVVGRSHPQLYVAVQKGSIMSTMRPGQGTDLVPILWPCRTELQQCGKTHVVEVDGQLGRVWSRGVFMRGSFLVYIALFAESCLLLSLISLLVLRHVIKLQESRGRCTALWR